MYINILKLFARCFLYVLPFGLIGIIISDVFDYVSSNLFFNIVISILSVLVETLSFAIIISINHQFYLLPKPDYLTAINHGAARTPQLFIFTLAFGLIYFAAFISLYATGMLTFPVMIITSIFMIIIHTYLLIVPALIVNHGYSAFHACINSVKLMKGNAIDAFFLMFIFTIIILVANALLGTIASLILAETIFASLMVYLSNTLVIYPSNAAQMPL